MNERGQLTVSDCSQARRDLFKSATCWIATTQQKLWAETFHSMLLDLGGREREEGELELADKCKTLQLFKDTIIYWVQGLVFLKH